MRDLFYFGLKSLPASGLTQINQRADVLILGAVRKRFRSRDLFAGLDDRRGFSSGADRGPRLFAPSLIAALEFAPASEKRGSLKKRFAFHTSWRAAATAVALIGFPFFLSWSGLGRNFSDSFPIFAVLQVGMALAAGYIVLGTILMLGNRPADQSRYVAIAVAINISANFALAATYGARRRGLRDRWLGGAELDPPAPDDEAPAIAGDLNLLACACSKPHACLNKETAGSRFEQESSRYRPDGRP